MRTAGRFGLIALIFLVLSVPAGAVCEALGEWMTACHEQASHAMPGCSDETAWAPSCCGSSLSDSATELVLKRAGEEDLLAASAFVPVALEPLAAHVMERQAPEIEPPPRPPRYTLFSSLLL